MIPSSSEVEAMLRELLAGELPERARDVQACAPDANLRATGLMDSLIFVVLIDFLEQKFGFSVPPEHLIGDRFASLTSITRYVISRSAENPGG